MHVCKKLIVVVINQQFCLTHLWSVFANDLNLFLLIFILLKSRSFPSYVALQRFSTRLQGLFGVIRGSEISFWNMYYTRFRGVIRGSEDLSEVPVRSYAESSKVTNKFSKLRDTYLSSSQKPLQFYLLLIGFSNFWALSYFIASPSST